MREFGSEYPTVLLPDHYFDSFRQFGKCYWLRSGREALYLVALNLKSGNKESVVLMPAYCCQSMVDPFVKAGWKVVYYRLNKNLTVDTDYLTNLLAKIHPKAALTMNFYGAASTAEAVFCIKCGYPECFCIEDFSHCTFSLSTILNPLVDYYVSSIRKSVGVCDGAVIITHLPLDESYVEESEVKFVNARKRSQKLKADYFYSQNSENKKVFLSELHCQEEVLDRLSGVHRISSSGKEMLSILNGEMIRYARKNNMEHILSLLYGKVECIPGIEKCLDGAPFSMPILVKDRDNAQRQLAQKGVYAPVLWPICEEARSICSVSARMADEMLSLPIDQRYNYDDIEEIARIVLETL